MTDTCRLPHGPLEIGIMCVYVCVCAYSCGIFEQLIFLATLRKHFNSTNRLRRCCKHSWLLLLLCGWRQLSVVIGWQCNAFPSLLHFLIWIIFDFVASFFCWCWGFWLYSFPEWPSKRSTVAARRWCHRKQTDGAVKIGLHAFASRLCC